MMTSVCVFTHQQKRKGVEMETFSVTFLKIERVGGVNPVLCVDK